MGIILDSQMAIKELHYEISKVAKEVQELYVEPDTAQIEMDEKTKKVLEEYIPIDISSGLPEQVELLDLKDKADEVKEAKEASIRSDRKDLFERIRYFEMSYDKLLTVGKVAEIYREDKNEEKLDDALKQLERVLYQFMDVHHDIFEEFERIDLVDHFLFGFPEMMKSEIAEGKEKIEEIRKLKEEFDLPQNILSVKGEIKVMEELRDSKAIQKILDFMEKIKGSFESIKESGLDHFEWKISYFSQKWVPIQNYLKNLKVPTEDQTKPITKIEECLQTFDFSMDFSTEETELLEIKESFKDVSAKINLSDSERRAVDESKMLAMTIDSMKKWLKTEKRDWNEFAKLRDALHMSMNLL
ncbi:hypothetical protein CAEBREN_32193 [Caenorhabditis brenneri]|uniref:Uncharacterized protein n=1 Tax=Caenorhabditis brenneri TaxID=135651 RepID=G0NC23_CAEBE|nr:hypothetical protein CAEBREN_32193 [Caenorhabditis brenneri]